MISRTTGVLAAVTLCLAIAAVNLPNPLVPLYAQRFGLSPLMQSMLFSAYLLALLATLLVVIARPQGGLRSQLRRLCAALALCVLADLVMLVGSDAFAALVVGRVIAGVAAGLATGASAAIALAGLGERSRTSAGTGAVVGALFANLLGGVLGSFLAVPFAATYLAHAGLVVLVGIALFVSARRGAAESRRPQRLEQARPVVEVVGGYHRRHRIAGYLIGALSWTTAGIVLALVAADLRQSVPSLSLLATMIPGCLFLASAWVGQALSGSHLLRMRAWTTCVPVVLGVAGIGGALLGGDYVMLLVASVLCGLGQGPSYSLGLATVTHGLPPSRQGRAASSYAAVAYGACGVLTVIAGGLANRVGVPEAFITYAVVFGLMGTVATALAGPAQRLRVAAAS